MKKQPQMNADQRGSTPLEQRVRQVMARKLASGMAGTVLKRSRKLVERSMHGEGIAGYVTCEEVLKAYDAIAQRLRNAAKI
jgi:hypothetical protein